MSEQFHAGLAGRLVFVGFGSVAQAVLPLIRRHIAIDRGRITIFTADERGRDVAEACGVADFRVQALTPDNYEGLLVPSLREGGLLLNLSYDVSSVALIEFCHRLGVPYLDSCIEPWAGGYFDSTLTPTQRSNYEQRRCHARGHDDDHGTGDCPCDRPVGG